MITVRPARSPKLAFILLAVLVVSTPGETFGQGQAGAGNGGPIQYQQTMTGKLTNDSFRIIYTFQGRKGDIIDATLTPTDATLDPLLLLTDDQNNLLAIVDSGANFKASISEAQLPADGNYFLIVTRFGQQRGLTTGGYSLTLTLAGVANAGSGPNNAFLQYGDSVVGEINGEAFQQVYAFQATRGDVIQVTMKRISGDLDSYLILADANGNLIAVNDEDPTVPGTLDAGIYNTRIEQSGTYQIIATRFGKAAGQSKGGYSLSLTLVPNDQLGKKPEQAILLDNGMTLKGDVDSQNVLHFYVIEAHKNDVLTIVAQNTRGNLDPTLALFTADLKPLATNDSGVRGASARISGYTVQSDGNYILVVSRFNADKGITSGSYAVSLVVHAGATVGAGGRLTLQYGGAVSAIVNDTNPVQQITFAAGAGDVISVDMQATSGDLLPELILLDPSGKQVALDDPGSGEAKLTRIKLGVVGNYVIAATRRGRDKGNTQGAYILTLTR